MQPSTSISAIVVFDIDGVLRDVSGSYRRALADTVEHFTHDAYRPTPTEIDQLKAEGMWNNDWEASQELVYRYFERQGTARSQVSLDYDTLVAFFQSRYRGPDPQQWTGYICNEPLLVQADYFESLTAAEVVWGFFSGATRASATYVLEKRIGLQEPLLVAMEDALGKPDPTGLLAAVAQLEQQQSLEARIPVIYVGDTVADMQTIARARVSQPERLWIGVGVIPPHAQGSSTYAAGYAKSLSQAGAIVVFENVQQLTPTRIDNLVLAALSGHPQSIYGDMTV